MRVSIPVTYPGTHIVNPPYMQSMNSVLTSTQLVASHQQPRSKSHFVEYMDNSGEKLFYSFYQNYCANDVAELHNVLQIR